MRCQQTTSTQAQRNGTIGGYLIIIGAEIVTINDRRTRSTNMGVIEKYGADALRLYEIFMGPPEQTTSFDPHGVRAMKK